MKYIMNKFLVTILLALISASAMAEWTRVPGGEDADFAVYVDTTTVHKKENKVKMWELFSFKTVQEFAGIRYLSTKNYVEYDCKQVQTRTHGVQMFSKNMGDGKPVHDISEPDIWRLISPGSLNEVLYKIACEK